MRLFPLLAVGLALVLAGCAKNDTPPADGSTTTTTMPTPTGSTTPTGSSPSTTPTGSTPTTTTPTTTTPTVMTPKDIKSGTVTFPDGCSTAGQPAPCPSIAFTVDAGYTMLNFTVTWSCTAAPPCGSNGASMTAAGLACPAPQTIGPTDVVKPCIKTGAAAAGKITAVPDALGMTATYKLQEM